MPAFRGDDIECAVPHGTDSALRSSEERFAVLFRASPDAICVCRQTDNRLIEINDRWTRLFGFTEADAVGHSPTELGVFADVEQRQRLYERLGAEGQVQDFEIDVRTKDGELRHSLLTVRAVDVGATPCFISVVRDITAQRSTELELQTQRQELAHLSRVAMLGELSGALAHELRQPLTSMLLNVHAAKSMVSGGERNDEVFGEILDEIVVENHRARQVIDRLRDMIGQRALRVEALDAGRLVTDALAILRLYLLQRGVMVATSVASDLPPVLADHVQVQQILMNLIVNGCDAMDDMASDERRLTIRAEHGSMRAVRISVVDQGCGIPPESMARIFEPFFTTKRKGMGLGLAISRRLVMAHGGSLLALGNEPRGAIFQLELPRSEVQPAATVGGVADGVS